MTAEGTIAPTFTGTAQERAGAGADTGKQRQAVLASYELVASQSGRTEAVQVADLDRFPATTQPAREKSFSRQIQYARRDALGGPK